MIKSEITHYLHMIEPKDEIEFREILNMPDAISGIYSHIGVSLMRDKSFLSYSNVSGLVLRDQNTLHLEKEQILARFDLHSDQDTMSCLCNIVTGMARQAGTGFCARVIRLPGTVFLLPLDQDTDFSLDGRDVQGLAMGLEVKSAHERIEAIDHLNQNIAFINKHWSTLAGESAPEQSWDVSPSAFACISNHEARQ